MTTRHLPIKALSIFIILIALPALACTSPGGTPAAPTEVDQGPIYTQAAQTIQAEMTSQAPPTAQPVEPTQPPADTAVSPADTQAPPEATLAPEESPTPAPTNTPENTPTPETATISATVNTNCRSGPSRLFDPPVGVLAVGQTAEVRGRLADNSWWLIANPGRPGQSCWVWGETTNVKGGTAAIPVVTPPPMPPTPTFTATPGVNFSMAYVKVRSCGGTLMVILSVSNTGSSELDSLSLKITDLTDSDTLSGPAESDAPFMGTSEECPPGGDTLPAGKTYYIGGVIGSGNSGHSARATVKLCTENDLDGACLEKSLDFDIP